MRSELGKAVRRRFWERMTSELPMFHKVVSATVGVGEPVYRWCIATRLHCYVYLYVIPNWDMDCFTIELGCSPHEFPEYPVGHIAAPTPDLHVLSSHLEERNGRVRFRLPFLYEEEWRGLGEEPFWWLTAGRNGESEGSTSAGSVSAAASGNASGCLALEQALEQVGPRVDDAFERLKSFGIPYFHRFATEHRESA